MKFSYLLLLALLVVRLNTTAQTQVADKIIAIVSDKIILRSEIDAAYADYLKENPELPESEKCSILEQVVTTKMLVEQAERDSVIVTEEEVEGAIDNRVRYFVSMYGSEEKMEEVAGKTIYQLKDEYRPMFKDNITAQRMQQTIISSVKITPQEVTAFYNKIPQDSLPFYPSMVEVGQIVIKPEVNKEVDEIAINKLKQLREEIVSGKITFDYAVAANSDDPMSKDNGGELGVVGRDELVPEFAAAAFKLQNNEISPIVKTKYGYHIVQMMNRQGEKAKLRHILIKPLVTSDMVELAIKKADSVRVDVLSGKMNFSTAVGKYTYDDATKISGGFFTNQQTGNTFLQNDELDPDVAITITNMKAGEYSMPKEYTDQSGDRMVRFVYLRSRTEPHKANLKDDYGKIQQVALAEKQNKYLFNWITEKTPTFYIKIDEEFMSCPNLAKWATHND